MTNAKRPIFYTGGGVINSGPKASQLLTELVRATGFPITNTLMGLGGYAASDKQFVGMLGMHGSVEANMAMYNCDVMINIGARFDDRVTGKLDAFSPNSRKIHVDIDPSSINKTIPVDIAIIGDCASVLEDMLKAWRAKGAASDQKALKKWWDQIAEWRKVDCFKYDQPKAGPIKPQHAIKRLYELTKGQDVYVTTDVGQHQMWAAQYFLFEEPNRLMTSGGLGTMGYGLPSALGVQIAHPKSKVFCITSEASFMMNIQEVSTAVQYGAGVKILMLNNKWQGMVRQWQELLHGGRYSNSFMYAMPDFVKLFEAFGAVGLRAEKPSDLDGVLRAMIAETRPVIADVMVDEKENCYPMIPSGAPHNQILLGTKQEIPAMAIEGMSAGAF
jgi:acetolactate synthase-1/2/3 large subunit